MNPTLPPSTSPIHERFIVVHPKDPAAEVSALFSRIIARHAQDVVHANLSLLHREPPELTDRFVSPGAYREYLERLSRRTTESWHAAFIAVRGGSEIVGYADAIPLQDRTRVYEIGCLIALPYQHCGGAKLLIPVLLQQLRQINADGFIVTCCEDRPAQAATARYLAQKLGLSVVHVERSSNITSREIAL